MILGYLATQWGTTQHKFFVMFYAFRYCKEFGLSPRLIYRVLKHDLSKYRWSEAKNFAKVIFKLKKTTYGSAEYRESLNIIKESIDNHYKSNRHHPQYHTNGYSDMTELDKLEMLIDWISACRRHADGDILKSININKSRFGFDDDEATRLKVLATYITGNY